MFQPDSPPGSPQPSIRSVMSWGSSSGTLSSAARTIWTVRSSGRMSLSEPLNARPIGERAVETITASAISEPQLSADELLHDLVRAGPDLGDAGVAPGAGDAVLVHVAVATVHLHAVVEHVVLHLRGPPLGLGGVDGRQLLLGVRADALVDERLGDVDAGDEVGEQELGVLERADRLAERLPVLGVLDRLLEDLLGVGEVGDRRAEALLRQELHHRDEAGVERADQVGVA